MGKILYEVSLQYEPAYLLLVLMPVLIFSFTGIIKKIYGDKITALNMKIIKSFSLGAGLFVSFLLIIVFLGQFHMYNKTVGAYKRGEYETVEGYVENFDPMPYGGHKHESFEINGIKFSYSDFSLIQGYHNAKSHGGVITGDGQHLKIGYVYYNHSYGNLIVYIEQLQ